TPPFHPCLCPPPLDGRPSAVCSLLHFPSPCDARPLAGTLPCGARTFLEQHEVARDPHSLPELSISPAVFFTPRSRGGSSGTMHRDASPAGAQRRGLSERPVHGAARSSRDKCARQDSNLKPPDP